MTNEIITRTHCRACGKDLQEVLNLGEQRLNGFPATLEERAVIPKAPIVLMVCRSCTLAQLKHTVPPDWMYRQHYWYRSAINETMVTELQTIVKEACAQVPLGATDYVLDIGANDGTLLAAYREQPYPPIRAAVEPAQNLQDALARQTDILISGYFPTGELDRLRGRFKVITVVACAYDLEDPTAFFAKIAELLHPLGVVVVQFQDLTQQIQSTAFDNLVHEHLEYYTLGSLLKLTSKVGLEAIRVQQTPINGGSLRVTLRPAARQTWQAQTVVEQMHLEDEAGLGVGKIQRGELQVFDRFRQRIARIRAQVRATVQAAWQGGYPVDWYGASTKSNCSLQVLGLGPERIRQVVDRNPEKWGRLTLTGIPIVSEETWRQDPAPLTVIGIWQFREQVYRREWDYLAKGGRFLVPMPYAEIVAEQREAV